MNYDELLQMLAWRVQSADFEQVEVELLADLYIEAWIVDCFVHFEGKTKLWIPGSDNLHIGCLHCNFEDYMVTAYQDKGW